MEVIHSVFARKVWNRFDFQDVEEVDETVSEFEEAYRRYTTSQRLYTVTHRRSYLARHCTRTLLGRISF
ncbi:MAG: hypothetical protein R6U51_03935 [Anaerolineales bacterium]